MSKQKKKNAKNISNKNLGTYLSIFSVIISIIAVYFTFQQNSLTREHNRLSVIPHINSYFSDNRDEELFGVYIINNGLGTAIIKNLEVFVNGQEIDGDSEVKFHLAIKKLGLDESCFYILTPRNGDTMAINEELALIKIKNRAPKCAIAQTYLFHKGISFNYIIYYESLYGEKFKYTYLDNEQVRL